MKVHPGVRRRFWLLVVGISGVIFVSWLVWFGREIGQVRAESAPSSAKIQRPDVGRTLEQIFNQMGQSLNQIPSLSAPTSP